MNIQLSLFLPIPILQLIIFFSEQREQLKFKETCKLFLEFVNIKIFPILTSTLCGSGINGFDDGLGINAKLNGAFFGCLDSSSTTLYFTDYENHVIRRVDLKTNEVNTLCGTPSNDGESDEVKFYPRGIAMNEKEKVLYVSDSLNQLITKVSLIDGTIDTLCGRNEKKGRDDGIGKQATFHFPNGITFDSISQYLYVAERGNNSIRRVSVKDGRVETLCGSGRRGYLDGSFQESMFDNPYDVEWNPSTEELYVSDANNQVIRVVSLKERRVRTLCGTPQKYGSEDGTHNQSKLTCPFGLSLDLHSNYLYFSDHNQLVRRVSLSGEVRVSTICGSPREKGMRDGLRPLFYNPRGIVVDPHSFSLYVIDSGDNSGNSRVRIVKDRTRILYLK